MRLSRLSARQTPAAVRRAETLKNHYVIAGDMAKAKSVQETDIALVSPSAPAERLARDLTIRARSR